MQKSPIDINDLHFDLDIIHQSSVSLPLIALGLPPELTIHFNLNELEYISSIISKFFPLDDYSMFTSEKDLLDHFALCELKCIEYINKVPMSKRKMYKMIIYEALMNISAHSTNKHHKDIMHKINMINPLDYGKKEEYLDNIQKEFGVEKMPRFLVKDNILSIKRSLFMNNYEKFMHSFHLKKEILMASDYYIEVYNGNKKPFELCKNVKLIFTIVVLANHDLFTMNTNALDYFKENYPYYKSRLESNDDDNEEDTLMLTYDEIDMNFIDIPSKEATDLLKVSIDLINYKHTTNDTITLLLDIFISIYYIFKPNSNKNARSSLIFHNIISAFEQYYAHPPFNITTLFYYLESFDVIISHSANLENITMNYDYIHSVFSKDKDLKEDFLRIVNIFNKVDKLKANSMINNLINMSIFDHFSPLVNIELIPMSNLTHSNTITLLIGGFLSEESSMIDWKDIIFDQTYFAEFYYYKWPSDNFIKAITKTILWSVDNDARSIGQSFISAKKKARLSGELLGLIIHSKHFFPWQSVNLIGYSLGAHVIKHCLKTLYRLNKNGSNTPSNPIPIKNIIFTGGATSLSNTQKWSSIVDKYIAGRVINCYSTQDKILGYLYQITLGKTPIGIKEINMHHRIENIDLGLLDIGHFDYWHKFKEIMKIVKLY